MKFDIEKVPFSTKGSYIAISKFQADVFGQGNEEGIYFRSVHGLSYLPNSTMKNSPPFCGRIIPVYQNKEVKYVSEAEECELRLITMYGEIRMCFADEDTLLICGYGNGLGLDLELIDGNYAHIVGNRWEHCVLMNCGRSSRRFILRHSEGEISLIQPKDSGFCRRIHINGDKNNRFLAILKDIVEEWYPDKKSYRYEESRDTCRDTFYTFWQTIPEIPPEYEEAGMLAAYVNWSGIVKKEGLLQRDGMLMAKNWMCNIWSWDHCFNAIALSWHNPSLAWDQFMLLFDFQGESGRIPDCVSDTYAIWNFCKPPIHGWALSKMMKVMELTQQQYEEAYKCLTKWTQWWLTWRDEDGDGICEYHHGNDAGWDNSTVFRKSPIMELPDLAAFLIIQMESLQELAKKLGMIKEADDWQKRAEKMLQAMLKHCFDHDRPIAVISHTHEEVPSNSLILYLPLILGDKLSEAIRNNMIADLKSDRFLTPWGLATEAVNSQFYNPDGYWRGPIWAPSTLLLVEGLSACGEREFATELARKFCDMVVRSGCAENFDALTGEGLRDRAYTWTSSVFLILAHEYLL